MREQINLGGKMDMQMILYASALIKWAV
jgi:hypothetical protein